MACLLHPEPFPMVPHVLGSRGRAQQLDEVCRGAGPDQSTDLRLCRMAAGPPLPRTANL